MSFVEVVVVVVVVEEGACMVVCVRFIFPGGSLSLSLAWEHDGPTEEEEDEEDTREKRRSADANHAQVKHAFLPV